MDPNELLKYAEQFYRLAAGKNKLKYHEFSDGLVINGDCTDPEVYRFVKEYLDGKKIQLLHTDPPYFVLPKIFQKDKVEWDQTKMSQQEIADWMKSWIKLYYPLIHNRGSIYIWGGTGRPNNRPFFVFCSQIENNPDMDLTIANIITWKKKRAFGVKKNYLYTREECVYMVKADENNPRVFHIPLTNQLRGYNGFSEKYKAKSPYLRRTNIWDITELFQGKTHPTEKPIELIKIPIETSSNKGDFVLDLFGGSGSTATAAKECGRKFIVVEKDPTYYNNIINRLK
jgi:site-specific DNA-methyltransferase (adenine-specific)